MNHYRVRHMMTALGFIAAGISAAAANAADLDVRVDHVVPGPGPIHFVLYRGGAGFRHEDHAFRVMKAPAEAASASVRFQDVPPGQYAVMAYHDANSDQKLDLRFGMFPIEGWGLSNNPKVMGPPSFTASSFAVNDQSKSIVIDLHY